MINASVYLSLVETRPRWMSVDDKGDAVAQPVHGVDVVRVILEMRDSLALHVTDGCEGGIAVVLLHVGD